MPKEEGPGANCWRNFPVKEAGRIGDYRLYLACNKVTLSPDRGGVGAQTWEVAKAEAWHWDHRRVLWKARVRRGNPSPLAHLPHQQEAERPGWKLAKAALPCQSLWFESLQAPAAEQNGQPDLRIPYALVAANCKILMCYSMLGISQQLLFAWVMRPHYTLLDGALFLRPSIGFLSDLLPKQGIAFAHILGSKP